MSTDYCQICCNKCENISLKDNFNLTDKYRGSVHKACNLNYKITEKIPAAFYSLKVMMDTLNIEKLCQYISLKIVFDSLQLMNTSVSKLVNNLKSKDLFRYISKCFGKTGDFIHTIKKCFFNILLRKKY